MLTRDLFAVANLLFKIISLLDTAVNFKVQIHITRRISNVAVQYLVKYKIVKI